MPTLPRPLPRCSNLYKSYFLHDNIGVVMLGRIPAPHDTLWPAGPSQGSTDNKFRSKTSEKISFRNVPNWEQPETSRESVISKTEMSDEDPSRSPTPPVGPPEAMPPILSFAEKQEVSTHPLASIHIPTSRPHFTSTLQCPCPLGIHA